MAHGTPKVTLTNKNLQSISLPGPEEFWRWSCQAYSVPCAKERLLTAQDDLKADINLILLLIWMDQHFIKCTPILLSGLIQTSNTLSPELNTLRQQRRSLKGKPGYEALKIQELDMEKRAQKRLLESLPKKLLKISQPPFNLEEYARELDLAESAFHPIRLAFKNHSSA